MRSSQGVLVTVTNLQTKSHSAPTFVRAKMNGVFQRLIKNLLCIKLLRRINAVTIQCETILREAVEAPLWWIRRGSEVWKREIILSCIVR